MHPATQTARVRNPAQRPGPILLAWIGLVALFGCERTITDADIRQVDIGEVRSLTLRQAKEPEERIITLIDPRASARFAAAHLPGARNLKLPQVPEKSSIDPSIAAYKHIVVYGTDPGNAAARAMAKRLMRLGYKGVRHFAGGVSEWMELGYPVEAVLDPTPEPTSEPTADPARGAGRARVHGHPAAKRAE